MIQCVGVGGGGQAAFLPFILYLLGRHGQRSLQLKKTGQKEEIGLTGNLIN